MRRAALIIVMAVAASQLLTAQVLRWDYRYDIESGGDIAYSIAYGPDGNTYTAGCRMRYIDDTPKQEFTVISLRPDGTQRWIYVYDIGGVNMTDCAYSVIYGGDGTVYAAGMTYGTSKEFTVVRLNAATGDLMGLFQYVWPGTDEAYSLVYGSDGNIYAAGSSSWGLQSAFTVIGINFRVNPPETLWVYKYNPLGIGIARALVQGPGGHLYVTGEHGTSDRDFVVVSLTLGGGFRWDYRVGAGNGTTDWGSSIVSDPVGANIYAAGTVFNTTYDFTVIKLNSDGGLVLPWPYYYPGTGVDEAHSLVCDPDGNVYAAGAIYVTNNMTQLAVVSLPSSGPPYRWAYLGGSPWSDVARSIVYGADDNVYATGNVARTDRNQDLAIVSLRSSDGGMNWPSIYMYDGEGNDDQGYSIAGGLDGDVYAAGWSIGDATDRDFTVLRVNPTSGLFAGSTEPSSGRHLGRELGTNKLHAVYHTAGQGVCYSFSPDGGQTWTQPALVDQGLYPSVGVISMPIPIDMWPVVVYLHDSELRYRYYDVWTQNWLGFSIQPPVSSCIGPPSVYVTGTTVHVVYPARDFMGLYGIYYNAFEYGAQDPGNYEMVESSFNELAKPSLVCDGMWNPHVIYEKESRLWYAYRHPMTGWQHDRQIQSYPGVVSYEPFIEYWGDYVHAPWAEAWDWPVTNSDVFRSERYLTTNNPWIEPVPVSIPDGYLSESPVNAAGDVFVYAEYNEGNTQTLDPEFYSMLRRGFVEETPVPSDWPHNQLYVSPSGDPDLLFTLWTEGTPPNSYVNFKSTDMSGKWSAEPRVFYPVTCGKEQASAYCLSRTGYMKVNGYGIDHGDSLVYNLLFLDPCYDFAVKIAGIHGGSTTWEQEVTVDGQNLGAFTVRPVTLETLKLKIPLSAYEKDHTLRLVFTKKSGSYAFCQSIKLYRYERTKKAGTGGGQSVVAGPVGTKLSLEVRPNPVLHRAVISYSLPGPSVVSLKVFDVSGRMVRNLCSGKYSSGQHLVVWDARDDMGMKLPNGVYFLNLKTSDHKLSDKLLLLR